MSHQGPKNALNDYFSDLLGEEADAIEAGPTPVAKTSKPEKVEKPPAPKVKAALSPKVQREVDDQIAKAEHEKRNRVQALLDSATEVSKPEVTLADVETVTEKKVELKKEQKLKTRVNPARKTDTKASPSPATLADPEISTVNVTKANEVDDALVWKQGRPIWAENRFDVLLFNVSGLTLAVPLVALGQIHRLTDDLTPLFGQSDWFMGLMPTPQGQLKTVNTAKFVMPERYDEKFLEQMQFIVSIDNSNWGLAVESVKQPVTLSPEDVKWRDERSKRPWLAGTVKSSMCALLDIPQIAKMLADAERSKGK